MYYAQLRDIENMPELRNAAVYSNCTIASLPFPLPLMQMLRAPMISVAAVEALPNAKVCPAIRHDLMLIVIVMSDR